MKIYFAYKENGEFDGFYNSEIHQTIPEQTVEITEELQNILLTGVWVLDVTKLNDISSPIDLNDKDIYFKEKIINTPEIINSDDVLFGQITSLKIDLLNKNVLINSLVNQLAQNKIAIMKLQLQGGK